MLFRSYVPNKICQQFGFQRVDSVLNDIEVDWNEQLVDSKDVLKDMDEDDGFDGYRL